MSNITIIEENENSQEPKNFQKGYLTFPFDGEQFKEFITGLLGKPQTISKRILGNFEIHLSDLQSFYNLVNQRITQQNNGHLVQFTAKVFFTDHSSVQLNSYDELITYNEVKPIISEAVKLTWTYLIQFSDKNHPEKQVVELLIISATERISIENSDLPIFLLPNKGEFRINIEHTARSWGSDIEALLTNQIESLIKEDNKLKKIIRQHSSKISLSFSILFFLICVIGAFKVTNNFINSQLKSVNSFISSPSSTNDKVDFLAKYIASGVSAQHFFQVSIFILVSIILSIIFGIWIGETASKNSEPSFVILTRKAKEHRDLILEKLKYKWRWFCVSIIISILTGLLTNLIFKLIVE